MVTLLSVIAILSLIGFILVFGRHLRDKEVPLDGNMAFDEELEMVFYEPTPSEIATLDVNMYTFEWKNDFRSNSLKDVLRIALISFAHAGENELAYVLREDVAIASLTKDSGQTQLMIELAANPVEFGLIYFTSKELLKNASSSFAP